MGLQVTDTLSLGICPKYIVYDTALYTARSKNGMTLIAITALDFAILHLKFDIGGNVDYGGLVAVAGSIIPGVKDFSLNTGNAEVLDPHK